MEIKFLSCPLCTESHFQNVVVLRNALIDVTKKPLTCPVCEEVLLGLDKFTIHLFTHTNLIVNENNDINKTVSNTNNDKNNNENSNCIITTSNNNCTQLQSQVTQNIVVESKPVHQAHCQTCNIDFTDLNMLDMHKTLVHSNGFSCHLCHKKFKMHGSLMVHMRVAHYGFSSNTKEDDNNQQQISTFTIANDTENVQKSFDNKQWECEVCLKRFTTKYFLKKHKRLHTGEMPYECTLCNKSFTFQQSYHKHMLYHSADKPHVCNECGRAFKELSTLHNHQRIHSGERPFACETCGKRFRQRVSYLVHKRIHTGVMPYKCTSCEKSFRYKVSQRTHKCKAQPPGAIVRQFGDLVQKLLQNHPPEETLPPSTIIATDVNKLKEQSSQPSIENQSEKQNPTQSQNSEINTDFFGLILSPTFQVTSEQFESLCLNNKDNENSNEEIFNNLRSGITLPSNINTSIESDLTIRQECSTINEECFKELLYNTSN